MNVLDTKASTKLYANFNAKLFALLVLALTLVLTGCAQGGPMPSSDPAAASSNDTTSGDATSTSSSNTSGSAAGSGTIVVQGKVDLTGRWEGTYSYFDGSQNVNCQWGAIEITQTATELIMKKYYGKCSGVVVTWNPADYLLNGNQVLSANKSVGTFVGTGLHIQTAPVQNQLYTIDLTVINNILSYQEKTTSFGYQFQGRTFNLQYVGPVTNQLPDGLGPAF